MGVLDKLIEDVIGTDISNGEEFSMRTASGTSFDFINPKIEQVNIEDVSHYLSNLCRFNGATNKFYSVAQHSVIVSKMVPEKFMYEGLMHDAAEAYLGDIITPFKRLLQRISFFSIITERVEKTVAIALGAHYPEDKIVKTADTILKSIEAKQFKVHLDYELPEYKNTTNEHIEALSQEDSKKLFLERFYELSELNEENN